MVVLRLAFRAILASFRIITPVTIAFVLMTLPLLGLLYFVYPDLAHQTVEVVLGELERVVGN